MNFVTTTKITHNWFDFCNCKVGALKYSGQRELQTLRKMSKNIKIKIKEHKQKTKPRKNLRTMQVVKLKLIGNYFDFSSRLMFPVGLTNQDSPILAVLLYHVSS